MLGWFKKKINKRSELNKSQTIVENEENLQQSDVPSEEQEQIQAQSVVPENATSSKDIDNEKDADQKDPVTPKAAESKPELQHNLKESEEAVVDEKEPAIGEEPTKKKEGSFFKKLTDKLSRTRETFTYQIDTLFMGKKEIDADLLDELEEILITADLGVSITQELLDTARKKVKRKELSDPESLKTVLKDQLKSYMTAYDQPAELVMPEKGPFIIMVIGVNGVGKTTTIGKIAHKFLQSGQTVLLVAGDTFRAAAVSQLRIWADRNGIDIVAKENADPSSVAFDAMDKAKSGNYDVVLVDTAGRLHTQDNLMEELKKIKRVIGKQIPGAPHEIMLVLDATTGQNGVSQAKLFNAAVDITGITLTKLDGTAKGGIVANISKELKTPIRFIGIGEQIEDLRDFNANDFIDALFHTRD